MFSQRAALIADTAIVILAERGARGLTHRAVDEAASLPPGSTSNHARTRAALLELALSRLVERQEEAFSAALAAIAPGEGGEDREGGEEADPAALVARAMYTAMTEQRVTTIARYELAMEANRRPELRKVYDELGRRYREPVTALLAAAGSPDPVRQGRQLVAYAEGLLFDAVVGAGGTPSLDDLRAAFGELLGLFLRG
ncbi:TetR/AcrR family transcriptional regulator [Sphaerimonospora sp. CA-214678]|uniref:TetR/AcrR family transcriptional regulator n=1 Tax=Sphaerimonospora sp. CA-214678 TaxID=3240029 RepID=UPI003D928EC5